MAVELKALLRILADVRDLKKGTQELNRFHKNLFSIRNVLKAGLGFGGALVGVRALGSLNRLAVELPRNIVSANLQYERQITLLRAVSGGLDNALALYDRSLAVSQQYGRELDRTAGNLANLMATTRGTRLEGEKTLEIWEALIASGTVLQLSGEDMEGVFRAVTQMVSKGRVSMEELNQQMGERLPGTFRLAADAMGVTTDELDKMLRRGELMAEDLLPRLARELNRTYGPDVERAAQSTTAQINRLNTEITLMFQTLGRSGFMDAFTDSLDGISELVKDPQFQDGLRSVAELMGRLAELSLKAASAAGNLYAAWQKIPAALKFSPLGFAINQLSRMGGGPGTEPGEPQPPDAQTPAPPAAPATTNLPQFQVNALDATASFERELTGILFRQRRLETDTLRAQADKQGELNALLEAELWARQMLAKERALQLEQGVENIDQELALYKELQDHLLRIAEIENERRVQSFGGSFQESFINLADDSEQIGGRIGDVFTGGINDAIASTSQSLGALIFQTNDWGESFLRIGQNIVASLIQIGLQEAALYGIRSLFRRRETAEVLAAEAAKAPALQANAAAASIGTAGGAAISGMTWALIAAGAITAALAFRERGGEVRAGQPYIVGERRPELFVPRESGRIEPSLNTPAARAALGSEAFTAAALPQDISTRANDAPAMNVALVSSVKDAEEWLETQDGRGRIVEIMSEERGALLG